ncbi:hypothetical protein WICPIJ_000395 [Wickerhamomyces pijperi]|uniref:Uncharacterized protein n=1 Tax=Wickerhamomyces pijperi TaxID=599730 RepID=A0A9P8TRW2_WICPI|nr:hypothetical protein WICPIJ_000395 [Wickerhamomyces pijperi]
MSRGFRKAVVVTVVGFEFEFVAEVEEPEAYKDTVECCNAEQVHLTGYCTLCYHMKHYFVCISVDLDEPVAVEIEVCTVLGQDYSCCLAVSELVWVGREDGVLDVDTVVAVGHTDSQLLDSGLVFEYLPLEHVPHGIFKSHFLFKRRHGPQACDFLPIGLIECFGLSDSEDVLFSVFVDVVSAAVVCGIGLVLLIEGRFGFNADDRDGRAEDDFGSALGKDCNGGILI